MVGQKRRRVGERRSRSRPASRPKRPGRRRRRLARPLGGQAQQVGQKRQLQAQVVVRLVGAAPECQAVGSVRLAHLERRGAVQGGVVGAVHRLVGRGTALPHHVEQVAAVQVRLARERRHAPFPVGLGQPAGQRFGSPGRHLRERRLQEQRAIAGEPRHVLFAHVGQERPRAERAKRLVCLGRLDRHGLVSATGCASIAPSSLSCVPRPWGSDRPSRRGSPAGRASLPAKQAPATPEGAAGGSIQTPMPRGSLPAGCAACRPCSRRGAARTPRWGRSRSSVRRWC